LGFNGTLQIAGDLIVVFRSGDIAVFHCICIGHSHQLFQWILRCRCGQQLPHPAKVKTIQSAVCIAVACLPVSKYSIRNLQQPLLHQHNICGVQLSVSVDISGDAGILWGIGFCGVQ